VQIPYGLTGLALRQALEVAKGDELDRLFAALSDELGDETGLSASGLIPIREDAEALRLIVDFLDTDEMDEEALVDAITPHVDQIDEQTGPRETARRVVKAIEKNAWRARKKDRDAIVHETRRLHQDRAAWSAPRYLSLEWAPREAHSRLQQLSTQHPEEARDIEDALSRSAEQRASIERLIGRAPPWLAQASPAAWEVLGHLAAAYGSWRAASDAFLSAADRPGGDDASFRAKAAEMAKAAGDSSRHAELLADARTIDPNHPDVALADAKELDPAAQLARLANVEAKSPAQAAALDATRALAHLVRGEVSEARACTGRAQAAAPESPFVREVVPLTTLLENLLREPGVGVDSQALDEAAERFLELHSELAERGRTSEALGMLARAVESYVVSGEIDKASDLIASVSPEDLAASEPSARVHLAKAALGARDTEAIGRFLPPDCATDECQWLRATAKVLSGDGSIRREGLEELDGLLPSDDEPVRLQASLGRLAAAAHFPDVEWSQPAEDALAPHDEDGLIPLLKAQHLIRAGDQRAAEDLLLDHQGDPRALEILVELAEASEDWARAVALSETLVEIAPSPTRRLLHAEMLIRAERPQEAVAALGSLSGDQAAPTPVRARAFAASAQAAWRVEDFTEVVRQLRGWLDVVPSSSAARWGLVQAQMRLGDYDAALATLDEGDGQPRDVGDARTAAYLYSRSLPAGEALRRIAELSDQFEGADEYLEGLIVLTGLGVQEDLSPELHERRQAAFQAFPSRFPDSQMIQAIPAPETDEAIVDFLRDQLAAGAEARAETERKVAEGEAPVALIAAMTSKEVSTVWGRLGRLPLGFGDTALDDLERADAAAAIGHGAVWDSSALVIAGGLGGDVLQAIRQALPASVIPQSVLEDTDHASHEPFGQEGEEMLFAGWDAATDSPRITVVDPETVARDRYRAEGVFEIARQIRAVPDLRTDQATRYDEPLNQPEIPDPLRAWISTFAVAARTQLPIYSDDRHIRVQARREGLSAFGTVALLEVLAERGRISSEQLRLARRRLRSSGALGVPPAEDELLDDARSSGWDLSENLIHALIDPATWRTAQDFRKHVALLRAVFEEAPERLPEWFTRVVDAARIARKEPTLERPASLIIALAWGWHEGLFLRALVAAVPHLRDTLGYLGDPVGRAFDLLLGFGHGKSGAFQSALLREVLQKLEEPERGRMLRRVGLI
jgi:hypothetical protein